MRIARAKMRGAGCYYHLVNRVAGTRDDRPFDDVEKELLVRLLKRLSQLCTVEVIAYCVMSNHFHLIVYAPDAPPALPEAVRRLNEHYQPKVPYHVSEPRVAVLAARLPDISHFMHDLQQQFTSWFNRTRPGRRRGGLWAERFKRCVVIWIAALSCRMRRREKPLVAGNSARPRGSLARRVWARTASRRPVQWSSTRLPMACRLTVTPVRISVRAASS